MGVIYSLMKSSELLKKVKRAGWLEVRQSGSHIIFQNPVTKETVSVPFHGTKEVPTGTAKAILKKVGVK
ncbi:MAG: type II toxin-antitoxin system HicA family toxin [Chitinophagaceae bacterium]